MPSNFRPIADSEMLLIAERMLKDIKASCPRFSWPADNDERERLVRLWARALRYGSEFPRFVYDDAVVSYAASASRDDNPPMPGDILRHCKLVMERSATDPVMGGRVADWRDSRRAYRDAALNGG